MIDTIYALIVMLFSIVGAIAFGFFSKSLLFMHNVSGLSRVLAIAGGIITGLVSLGFVLLFLLVIRAIKK